MLDVLWWIYWIGFIILLALHIFGGNMVGWGRVTRNGKLLFRVPACLAALFMTALWPILLPIQLAQNK